VITTSCIRPCYVLAISSDCAGQALANGNMVGYEIDFLGANFVGSPSMFENVTSAHTWYAGMARAAEERGITIQYCLSYPSDILISVRNYKIICLQNTFPSLAVAVAAGVPVSYQRACIGGLCQ
jgi:hypothetical protein